LPQIKVGVSGLEQLRTARNGLGLEGKLS